MRISVNRVLKYEDRRRRFRQRIKGVHVGEHAGRDIRAAEHYIDIGITVQITDAYRHPAPIHQFRGSMRTEFHVALILQIDKRFAPFYFEIGVKGDRDDIQITIIIEVERRESFVYLQNYGNMKFSAHTTPELVNGRWMTIGVGDLDGDADVDIVLGGAIIPTGMFAHMDTFDALAESAPSILVLKNTVN